MIFRTFNGDIDRIITKWGILGKSFNDFVEASNKRKIAIDDLFTINGIPLKDAKKQAGSFWSYLYTSKESIQSQMVDVESLYPNKTDTQFSTLLSNLQQQQQLIDATKGSWSDYFKNFDEGEKWQIKFVQNTDLQKASLDDVKKAYNSAREAALAQNAALKQQTLGAKAATVTAKALAVAGNMIVMLAISKAISLTYKAIDNYIHRLENAREELNKTTSEIESIDTELEKVRDTMDEILAKDTIDLTDENELKQLREEVELLEAKRKLLDAQEYEGQQETNKLITEQYNKYFKTAIVTKPNGSIVEEDALSYVKGLYAQAKEYSSSTVPLSEEEKLDFENIKEGAVDLGLQLTDLLEYFKPFTSEEEKQKENMEEMLGYVVQIADMYTGTIPDITRRLEEKFANGVSGDITDLWAREDRKTAEWIESLSDDDKKIMLTCDIDDASLDDLKRYLAEKKGKVTGTSIWNYSETITHF